MILELIKKSYKTIIENPSIPLYLVVLLIVVNIISEFISAMGSNYIALILSICLFMVLTSFIAGWFQILSQATKDDIKEKKCFPIFLEGVGKNVFPFTCASMLYAVFTIGAVLLGSFLAFKFFGNLEIVAKEIASNITENMTHIDILNSLNDGQKEVIFGWYIFISVAIGILNLLLMYYPAAIVFNDKSNVFEKPFVALIEAVKFLFKNFLASLGIFVAVNFVYFILQTIAALTLKFKILTIIILFVKIYLISLILMLIFNYYASKKEEKNNSDNRCDCIGENETLDSVGEENK